MHAVLSFTNLGNPCFSSNTHIEQIVYVARSASVYYVVILHARFVNDG